MFPPCETRVCVDIDIIEDCLVEEPVERFLVKLSNVGDLEKYVDLIPDEAIVAIVDKNSKFMSSGW